MQRVVRLNESDIHRMVENAVRRIISEESVPKTPNDIHSGIGNFYADVFGDGKTSNNLQQSTMIAQNIAIKCVKILRPKYKTNTPNFQTFYQTADPMRSGSWDNDMWKDAYYYFVQYYNGLNDDEMRSYSDAHSGNILYDGGNVTQKYGSYNPIFTQQQWNNATSQPMRTSGDAVINRVRNRVKNMFKTK